MILPVLQNLFYGEGMVDDFTVGLKNDSLNNQ
jgi:hypothetical protein